MKSVDLGRSRVILGWSRVILGRSRVILGRSMVSEVGCPSCLCCARQVLHTLVVQQTLPEITGLSVSNLYQSKLSITDCLVKMGILRYFSVSSVNVKQ